MKYECKTSKTLPQVEELLEDFSREDISRFIKDLNSAFSKKYNKGSTSLDAIKPCGMHMTYHEQQALKPSVNDSDYKPDILRTNQFGIDMSTREGSEIIMCKEDSELMANARLAEKKRIYRMVAKEEARLGLLPISLKQMKTINTLGYIQEMEKSQGKNKQDLKYAVVCEIAMDNIDKKTSDRLLKKTWIRDFNNFEKNEDGYRLIVGYEYTKSDGTTCKRTMSMMKKEIGSCLGLDRNKIDCRVICRDEYNTLTTREVD